MTPPVLNGRQTDPQASDMAVVLERYRTESGRTLLELADESPILLIFLRLGAKRINKKKKETDEN